MSIHAFKSFCAIVLTIWAIGGVSLVAGVDGGAIGWILYAAIVGLIITDTILYKREGGEFGYWRFLITLVVATGPVVLVA